MFVCTHVCVCVMCVHVCVCVTCVYICVCVCVVTTFVLCHIYCSSWLVCLSSAYTYLIYKKKELYIHKYCIHILNLSAHVSSHCLYP